MNNTNMTQLAVPAAGKLIAVVQSGQGFFVDHQEFLRAQETGQKFISIFAPEGGQTNGTPNMVAFCGFVNLAHVIVVQKQKNTIAPANFNLA